MFLIPNNVRKNGYPQGLISMEDEDEVCARTRGGRDGSRAAAVREPWYLGAALGWRGESGCSAGFPRAPPADSSCLRCAAGPQRPGQRVLTVLNIVTVANELKPKK